MRKNAVINLELAKNESLGVKFYAKQYDDIKIKARVFDGLDAIELDGQEVIVFIQKPDDTIVEQMDGVEIVNDEIVINLSKQATTALGECDVEVILRDEEGETATSTVSYVVIEKLSTAIIDVIQSSSDIHHLQLIEELIERADASLLSIETDIREIQEHLSDVEDNINAEYEGIMTALKALEEEIIDNVDFVAEEAKTEALDVIGASKEEAVRAIEAIKEDSISSANNAVGIVNEAVNNANNAVNKANEALETINEVKGEVDKIPGIVDTALSDIDTAKDDALDDIAMAHVNLDNAKDEAINAVGSARIGAVNAINESKVSGVSALDTARASAIGEIGVIKEDAVVGIESTRDEAISGVETVKEEAIREINNEAIGIKTRTIEELETGATGIKTRTIEDISGGADNIVSDVDAQIKAIKDGAISQVENIKAEAVSSINEAKISAVSGVENAGDEQVARVTRQGETSISDVDAKIQEMYDELAQMVSEKEALLEQNTLAGTNKAELIALIDEAKGIMGSLRMWIDSNQDNNVDLTEVIEAIDGLNERINLLDGTTYKTVGVNPVPSEVLSWVDNEGMFDRIKLHEGQMNKSAVVEFKMDRSAYSINITSSSANSCVDIRISRKGSGNYIKDILDMYTWNGSAWGKTSFSSTMSTLNIRISTSKAFMENIYESTLEAESSLGKLELKQIDREIYNDFNICTKELMYKINDDGTALNSPGITTGILTVEKAGDYIKQQVFGETDVLYRLYMGGAWTSWQRITTEAILD